MEALQLRYIVDTSVWISLHKGDIIPQVLLLTNKGWDFLITNFVALELQEPSSQTLIQQGVQLYPLSKTEVAAVEIMVGETPALTQADASLIVVAHTLNATILADDKVLREKAGELRVKVHGTLWLLEQLVAAQLIDSDTLCDALEKMIAAKRRFPKQAVNRLRTRYNCP
jgi:predicted nucleic acid-binding protein